MKDDISSYSVINEILILLKLFSITIKDFEEDIRILTKCLMKQYITLQNTNQNTNQNI